MDNNKNTTFAEVKDDPMFRKRIEEMMREKGISKVEFARRWGCAPQNVNNLLETENLKKLMKIAEVLGCNVTDLISSKAPEPQPSINGFIEFEGEIYKIKSMRDLNSLIKIIDDNKHSNTLE